MQILGLHKEKQLLQRLTQGSAEAFTTLYLHYSPGLYVALLRMVRDPLIAEEMVQELFTKIWIKRDTLQINDNFGGYIYRAARNQVLNLYARLKTEQQMLQRFKTLVQENYQHIEEALQYKENQALLQQALATLKPQQRRVYELCKIEGMSYQQAATIMGLSPATVNEHLVNAHKALRIFFNNNMGAALGLLTLSFLPYSG